MAELKALSAADEAAAVVSPDVSTKDFVMQQTMLRVKDPKKSLRFYTEVLGMRLLKRFDMDAMQFSVYFMGYEDVANIPTDDKERVLWLFKQKATIELTHNWGTENDETVYHNSNSEPRGFGHIGISVPDLDAACARFETLNVKFIKRPNDGKMRGLAFIQDPDGYWIEILSPNKLATLL